MPKIPVFTNSNVITLCFIPQYTQNSFRISEPYDYWKVSLFGFALRICPSKKIYSQITVF